MAPRVAPNRPFRRPDAICICGCGVSYYYCVPCEDYLPSANFTPWAMRKKSRKCRTCASRKACEAQARDRRANPIAHTALRIARSRATRTGIPVLITTKLARRLAAFWNHTSALDALEPPKPPADPSATPKPKPLSFYPIFPTDEFNPTNAVLLTAAQGRAFTKARLQDPAAPLPAPISARLQALREAFPPPEIDFNKWHAV